MPILIKSDHLETISDDVSGQFFVYHALFGNPRVLSQDGLSLLDLFEHPRDSAEVLRQYGESLSSFIEDLSAIHFLVPPYSDEREFLANKKMQHLDAVCDGSVVDRMGLAISDMCNLACSHCLHFQVDGGNVAALPEHNKPKNMLKMTWETAHKCVDQYLNLLREHGRSKAKIHFGNAEPLINWAVIKQILEYSRLFPKFEFEFAINTNLTLLTEKMARTLASYRVSIATSLDGTEVANDAIRVKSQGAGTFGIITEKFDLLERVGYPLDGFSITVTAGNFDLVDTDIIDLAYDRQMHSIAFDYDLIGLTHVPVQVRVEKLIRLKRYANARGIDFYGTWDSAFRNLTGESLLKDSHSFCAAVQGKSLEFNVDGSIKVCSHTTHTVGHVDNFSNVFAHSNALASLVERRYPGSDEFCRGCPLEGPCGGQCEVTREVNLREAAENGSLLFEDLCEFYRATTDALALEYLRRKEEAA